MLSVRLRGLTNSKPVLELQGGQRSRMLQAQGCTCGLGIAHQPRRAHCSVSRRRNRGQRTCRVWCGKGKMSFFFPLRSVFSFGPLIFFFFRERVHASTPRPFSNANREWRGVQHAHTQLSKAQGVYRFKPFLFTYNCRIKTCTPQSCPSTRPPCSVVGEKSSFSPDPSPTTTDKHASRALKCITVFPSGNFKTQLAKLLW